MRLFAFFQGLWQWPTWVEAKVKNLQVVEGPMQNQDCTRASALVFEAMVATYLGCKKVQMYRISC